MMKPDWDKLARILCEAHENADPPLDERLFYLCAHCLEYAVFNDPEIEGDKEKDVVTPLELSPRDVIESIDGLEGPICVYSGLAVDDLLEAIGIAK
ncbi:MAG: hypothetical protein ACYS47_15315 [Planctomycetota bacterium]|jgi:hypothetical protein